MKTGKTEISLQVVVKLEWKNTRADVDENVNERCMLMQNVSHSYSEIGKVFQSVTKKKQIEKKARWRFAI